MRTSLDHLQRQPNRRPHTAGNEVLGAADEDIANGGETLTGRQDLHEPRGGALVDPALLSGFAINLGRRLDDLGHVGSPAGPDAGVVEPSLVLGEEALEFAQGLLKPDLRLQGSGL